MIIMICNINELVKSSQDSVVEFVHADVFSYYSLCSSRITVSIDGNWVTLSKYSLRTGGSVWFDDDYNEHVECGEWTIDDDALPSNLSHLKEKVEKVINDNFPQGCCGGCV